MFTIKKQLLGFHKGQKRIWINNGTIQDACLHGGDKVEYDFQNDNNCLVIKKSSNGTHTITRTERKGSVIDIVNSKVTALFKDFEHVDVIAEKEQIIVKGHFAESKIHEREQAVIRRVSTGEPLRKGGACVGMGLLCRSIHRGLMKAGISVKQRFANEYNPIAAEVNLSGNEIWKNASKDAIFVISDMFTMDMSTIPKLDMLVIGSPCPPFSQLNTQHERDGKKDIFHEQSGTIFQPILEMIRNSNPAFVLLENSKHFSDSIFDYIMTDIMGRFGYKSVSTLVTGEQFGDYEKRERLCRLWYSKGLPEPDLHNLPFQQANERPFSDVFEPMDLEDKRWGRRKYLEAKHAESHNGHKYRITPKDATRIPTIGANYYKIQPDSPMIAHPDKPLFSRILTPAEHCNLRSVTGEFKDAVVAVEKGEHYAQRTSRGSAAEAQRMLGNSCSPLAWESVGYRLGEWLLDLVPKVSTPVKVLKTKLVDAVCKVTKGNSLPTATKSTGNTNQMSFSFDYT
ncbi:DNA cytosine methyltransferase [Vibrio sp. Y2-5]|uniref:DNA cytosine methyltransferase n=1 Tax=Vibrio sp. Y2-5 TaxID=2743977 RepID=UPI001660283A|nr:DNA cytosine methyltransferase [Vibrio sp. Y2-5]MBD0788174.1 DNA cytosine methyltransferase [Vibrio sp. Y2-5]